MLQHDQQPSRAMMLAQSAQTRLKLMWYAVQLMLVHTIFEAELALTAYIVCSTCARVELRVRFGCHLRDFTKRKSKRRVNKG